MLAAPLRATKQQKQPTVSVAVVDDSVVVRSLLSKWLGETSTIQVLGVYRSGQEIVNAAASLRPNVVLLDLNMPDMDGMTAIPLIISKSPGTRVIIVSAHSAHGAETTIRALMRGASDYIPKPSSQRMDDTDFRQALIAKVLAVGSKRNDSSRVAPAPILSPALVSSTPGSSAANGGGAYSPHGGKTPSPSPVSSLFSRPIASSPSAADRHLFRGAANSSVLVDNKQGLHVRPLEQHSRPRLLVIGASTGGPQALVTMLAKMKSSLKRVPVVIAQHMPPIFSSIFVSHLKQHAGLPAVEASKGEVITAGNVYLAPGGQHTVIKRRADGQIVIELLPPEAKGPWRPSIDLLFTSAATVSGHEALAIALTGMGRDGTEGANRLMRSGANILVQDEASSVVWGIPGSIAEAGLANAILPPEKLGELAASLLEGRMQ